MAQEVSLEEVRACASRLTGSDDFDKIILFLHQEINRLFDDLGPSQTPNEVMKQTGKIAAVKELFDILS